MALGPTHAYSLSNTRLSYATEVERKNGRNGKKMEVSHLRKVPPEQAEQLPNG
jgi:hypothetical protein